MLKLKTRAFVSGVMFSVAVSPAFGQDAEADALQRALEEQEQKIIELFQGLEDRDDEALDPRERLLEERRRLEQVRKQVMQLQLDRPLRFQFDAEPVALDAKRFVSPWSGRARADVVAALNHEDYAVRESAQSFLLADDTLSRDVLKALLQASDSPEQRQRLLAVAEHHVMREVREREFGQAAVEDLPEPQAGDAINFRVSAAVGYSYEPVRSHENPHADLPAVRVIATMPGFPGHAQLRLGDLIVRIDGQGPSRLNQHNEITNWVQFQIAQREAGDTIVFTLLRDGEPLIVNMVCAEGPALRHMYTTTASSTASRTGPYKRAWQEALGELSVGVPKPKMLTPVLVEPAR